MFRTASALFANWHFESDRNPSAVLLCVFRLRVIEIFVCRRFEIRNNCSFFVQILGYYIFFFEISCHSLLYPHTYTAWSTQSALNRGHPPLMPGCICWSLHSKWRKAFCNPVSNMYSTQTHMRLVHYTQRIHQIRILFTRKCTHTNTHTHRTHATHTQLHINYLND